MSVLHISVAPSSLSEPPPKGLWFMRVCAALCDDAGNVLDDFAQNIRSNNRTAEPGALTAFGIDRRDLHQRGIHEAHVARIICGLKAAPPRYPEDLAGLCSCAKVVVAWNADIVKEGMARALARMGEPSSAFARPLLRFISLRDDCTLWCKLTPTDEDTGRYRAPSRAEAAATIIGDAYSPPPGLSIVGRNLHTEIAIFRELLRKTDGKAFEAVAA